MVFHRCPRLFLRPAFAEDWEAIYAGIAEEGIVRNLARAPWPYAADDARAFAKRGQDAHLPGFMVTLPSEDGAPLMGGAGLSLDDDGSIQLGYWIARRWWGHGYATEAACGVIEVAAMLGIDRVVASHFIDNPASGRVLEKAGFVSTGVVYPQYSCGRGESAPARQFAIDLTDRIVGGVRQAA